MALVLTDLGADQLLKILFINTRATAGNDLYIHLFVNDVIPAQTGITYTEATGGGYPTGSPQNGLVLTMGSTWVVTPANDPSDAIYAQQTFTFTGALTTNPTIYGYYVTDADGVVLWAERFTTSFTPTTNGDNIKITPKFQMSSGTPA